MTNLEKIKLKLEFIEDDPTPVQLVKIIQELIEYIEEKQMIGFKNEKEK